MFTIKAGFSDKVELKANIEKVREFFLNVDNFVDCMPGVASIHTDAKGVAHWKIVADIPVIGKMTQNFDLQLVEDSEDRVEWLSVSTETRNFLRYSADFLSTASNSTAVSFSQFVELRRNSARDLHMLAGLAGEKLISSEMTKKISEMIKVFIAKAKQKIEL